MTGIAFRGGRYVSGIFAGCSHAVMAAAARLRYIAVIKSRTLPASCVMAVIAFSSRRYMLRVFSGSDTTVMTVLARTVHRGMINPGNVAKFGCVMAVITIRTRHYRDM